MRELLVRLLFILLSAKFISTLNDQKSLLYGGRVAGTIGIQNGKEIVVNDKKFPYMVQIVKNNNSVYCGGALIRLDTVVTAAHCYKNLEEIDVQVWAGSYMKLDTNSKDVQIRKVIIIKRHEDFDPNKQHLQPNDIALMFLDKKFIQSPYVNKINIASISERNQLLGEEATILGYGRMKGHKRSLYLRTADITILKKYECGRHLSNQLEYFHPDSVNCILSTDLDCASAAGDSGSPLVKKYGIKNDVLLGVSSFSSHYTEGTKILTDTTCPSIYTNVPEYKECITNTIREMKNEVKKKKTTRRNCIVNCFGN